MIKFADDSEMIGKINNDTDSVCIEESNSFVKWCDDNYLYLNISKIRRAAERRWLASGLIVHKQILNTIKHKVTQLVKKAKTNVYSTKEWQPQSQSCKELFRLTGSLMGKAKNSPLPSVYIPPMNQLEHS